LLGTKVAGAERAVIESRSNSFARQLFDGLPARYDALAELLSFWQNRRWRGALVDQLAAHAPRCVLDVATGTAGVAMAVARRTDAHVIGLDVTAPMLQRGLTNIARAGLRERVRLIAGTAQKLPFPDATFDAVSFTYLLRYVADPAAILRELARVLTPGGWMVSLEFFVPTMPLWRACWKAYTRWLLPAGGWLSGGSPWRDVGRFLGPNIEDHYRRFPLDWTMNAWRQAAMTNVEARIMSCGAGLVMWGQRSGG